MNQRARWLVLITIFLAISMPMMTKRILQSSTGDTGNTNNTSTSIDYGKCGDGCLKCSNEGKCLFCDLQNTYFWNNDGCVKYTIENCIEYTYKGNCTKCAEKYYLIDNGCKAIEESNQTPNCTYYRSESTCSACEDGYYMFQQECKSIRNKIENCVTYNSTGSKCVNCDKYPLSTDFTQCDKTASEDVENCKFYGLVDCKSCSSGYLKNDNSYLLQVFHDDASLVTSTTTIENTIFQYIYPWFSLEANGSKMIDFLTQCRKIEVSFCEEYESYNKCKKCKENNYLTEDKKCVQFPQERIQFCLEYNSAVDCKQCEPGFYRKSPLQCEQVIKIENCKLYDNFQESKCLECESDFFLESSQCKTRVISKNLRNCLKTFIDRDSCETCSEGFETNSEGSECLTGISNCLQYQKSVSAVTCIKCQDTYYLNSNKCELGAINLCKEYENQTQCLKCQEGSYLNAFKCFPHTLSEYLGCTQLSIFSKNLCTECSEEKVSFNYANHCEKSETEIQNCLIYSESGKCSQCDSKISYLSNNKCVSGTISKCVEYAPDEHRCVTCNTDLLTKTAYVPNSDTRNNLCVIANPNYHHNCEKISETDKKKCDMCLKNYYPKINDFRKTVYCVPTDFYEFKSSPNVENCGVFDKETLKCKICSRTSKGYFHFNNSGKCGFECPVGQGVEVYSVNDYNVDERFTCKTLPVFATSTYEEKFGIKCHRFEQNHELSGDVCSGCASDEIAVLSFDKNPGIGYMYSYMMTTGTTSTFSIFNRLTPVSHCLKKAVGTTTNATETAFTQPFNANSQDEPTIENCRFITETKSEVYQCGSCNFGYTGRVVRTLDNFSYMIEKCEILAECKTDIFYNGLGSLTGQLNTSNYKIPIDYYVSCHVCEYTNIRLIPTYGIVAVQDNINLSPVAKLYRISPFGVPSQSKPNERPFEVEELKHTKQTSCQQPGLTQIESFPNDCGIQELQTDKTMGPYLVNSINDQTNPICVACSPGYKATQDAVHKKAVIRCEKIQNCSTSDTFNKCSTCELGYAIKDGSDFTECIESTVRNCWIYSGSLSVCVQCMDGFTLANGVCDYTDLYRCDQKVKSFNTTTNVKETLSLAPYGFGCSECDSGFLGLVVNETLKICLRSDALLNDIELDKNPWIISNCQNYYMNTSNEIICMQCVTGYILQEDHKKCYALTSLPNCTVAANGGVTCLSCEQGYYYDNTQNKCVLGNIQNCKLYTNEIQCKICNDGYFATRISNDRLVCFEDKILNCADLDLTQAAAGTLHCNRCNVPYFLRTDAEIGSFPLKICLNIPGIENCSVFSKTTTVTSSTLECAQCIDSHYVNTKTKLCQKRLYVFPTCVKYIADFDGCSECQSQMYLGPSKKECVKYPTALVGCIEFQDENTCTKCGQNRYLQNNECIEVSDATRITNCQYYKNSKECLECDNSYHLSNNRCTQAFASNCLTYVDAKTCETCKTGYGLSKTEAITSCVFIQISNCEEPDYTSLGPNFKCKTCVSDFYPDSDGRCALITNKIVNCMHYSDADTCSKCKPSYVLDKTLNKCFDSSELKAYADENCDKNVLERKCMACQDGFYFAFDSVNNKTICQKCLTDSNCKVCDPDNPSHCLMCLPGKIMTKNYDCGGTASSGNSGNNNGNGNGTTDPTNPISIKIISALWGLLAMMLWLA